MKPNVQKAVPPQPVAGKLPAVQPAKRSLIPLCKHSHVDLPIIRRHGKKSVIFDASMISIVNSFVSYEEIRSEKNGVQKIYKSTQQFIYNKDSTSYVFFIRPTLKNIMDIITQIRNLRKEKKDGLKKIIYLVPRKVKLVERLLERYALLQDVTLVHSFGFDLIPLDTNLLTCSMKGGYKEVEVNGNLDYLYNCARSIVKFESVFGKFKQTAFIGGRAKQINGIISSIYKDLENVKVKEKPKAFDELIIFDRKVDLITPLLTPLSFGALVDSLYGIKQNGVFDLKKIDELEKRKMRLVLNDDDEIFTTVRYLDVNHTGIQFKLHAGNCKEFEKKENYDTITKMKDFIRKLPFYQLKKQSLNDHLNIAKKIQIYFPILKQKIEVERDVLEQMNESRFIEFVENMIIEKKKLADVFRYISLFSLVRDGIKQKVLEFFKKEIIHSYGIQALLSLKNLEDVGLIKLFDKNNAKKKGYKHLREKFNLFVTEKFEIIQGIGYVFGGYLPLSVQLIKDYLERNERFNNICEFYSCSRVSVDDTTILGKKSKHQKARKTRDLTEEERRVVVFFVGGVSRAEIAALKKIEKKTNVKFIVLTSELLSNFMNQFVDE